MSQTLTKKDFKSDQEVRWCPGCGDYAILSALQSVCAQMGVSPENTVFVSGIGCSSRLPYYMNTYGFHTIHGRAAAIATGVKTANPELSVWIATGDGDGLSIGGNHMAHILRRNLDVNILLFNNEIYGLTKGQYSPTSPLGTKTGTSPMGSVDRPFNPISFALGCNATFVARTVDSYGKHMADTFVAAANHPGTSFVEIYQNCPIFNDGAFEDVAAKKVRDDRLVDLQPGQPMTFGKDRDRGLKVEGFHVVECPAEEASIWDPTMASAAPAFQMSTLDHDPEMPNPIGVFRATQEPVFEDDMEGQIRRAIDAKGEGTLEALLYTGDTWEIH